MTIQTIHSSAPYRISFFGGGSDFPEWFTSNGGAVLSTTINYRCHIFLRRNSLQEIPYRIVWRHVELVNRVAEILHPTVRGALGMIPQEPPLEIHHIGDLPARTGIGSSSAFAVALLNGLYALDEIHHDARRLAADAIHLERYILDESGGYQDQVASAHGGLNHITFSKDGPSTCKIHLPKRTLATLEARLMLVYTGITRSSSCIAEEIKASITDKPLHKFMEYADKARRYLLDDRLDDFGAMFHEAWELKKSLADGISNPDVDHIYNLAMQNGALGGKALGSGGGGFMLFYVPSSHISSFVLSMPYEIIPFKFSNVGARLRVLS